MDGALSKTSGGDLLICNEVGDTGILRWQTVGSDSDHDLWYVYDVYGGSPTSIPIPEEDCRDTKGFITTMNARNRKSHRPSTTFSIDKTSSHFNINATHGGDGYAINMWEFILMCKPS